MKSFFLCISTLLCFVSQLVAELPLETPTRTYRVQQSVTLSEIPAGAKTVKWWIALPNDDRFQEVLNCSVVSAPGKWQTVREPDHGNRFLLVEVPAPTARSLTTKIEFLLRRRAVFVAVDPTKVGVITEADRRLYADELRQDAPHMEVSPALAKMAAKVCGDESKPGDTGESFA